MQRIISKTLLNPSWAHNYPIMEDMILVIILIMFIEIMIGFFYSWISQKQKEFYFDIFIIIILANIVSGIIGLGLMLLLGYW